MVKGLKTLIRLEKSKIDEQRRELVQFEMARDVLEKQSQLLLQQLEAELELAGGLTEMRGFFGDFSQHIKKQRITLHQQIALIERKMAALRDRIAIAFSEMKKFEIALQNHHIRERETRERAEQAMLDDVAVERFRRAREERL